MSMANPHPFSKLSCSKGAQQHSFFFFWWLPYELLGRPQVFIPPLLRTHPPPPPPPTHTHTHFTHLNPRGAIRCAFRHGKHRRWQESELLWPLTTGLRGRDTLSDTTCARLAMLATRTLRRRLC
jgi:hypothetical protein